MFQVSPHEAKGRIETLKFKTYQNPNSTWIPSEGSLIWKKMHLPNAYSRNSLENDNEETAMKFLMVNDMYYLNGSINNSLEL